VGSQTRWREGLREKRYIQSGGEVGRKEEVGDEVESGEGGA